MSDAIRAETVHIGDEKIQAYQAVPLGAGPFPGVVVIHHLPGFDESTKEMVRRFAANGYLAICPNLFWREAPGASPDDASAFVRGPGRHPRRADHRRRADRGRPLRAHDRPQRQGRRHRALLRRPAGAARRDRAAARRRRRLLRGVRAGAAAGGERAEDDLDQGPARRPGLPGARPVRRRRQEPGAGGGRPARRDPRGARQAVRAAQLRGRRPRVLRPGPARLPAAGRRRRLAADLRVLRPAPRRQASWRSEHVHVRHRDRRARGQRQGPGRLVPGHPRRGLRRPPAPRAVRAHPQHRLRRPGAGPVGAGRGRADRGGGPGAGRRDHRRPGPRPGGPGQQELHARCRHPGMGAYRDTYERSLSDPDRFWRDAAAGVDWERMPIRVLDGDRPPFYRWFPDAELNTCHNALDRHVAAGRAEDTALIYDSPGHRDAAHVHLPAGCGTRSPCAPGRCAGSASTRATGSSSTWRWCRRRSSRCSPAPGSAPCTPSSSAGSGRRSSPPASTTPGRRSSSPPPAGSRAAASWPTSRCWTRRSPRPRTGPSTA